MEVFMKNPAKFFATLTCDLVKTEFELHKHRKMLKAQADQLEQHCQLVEQQLKQAQQRTVPELPDDASATERLEALLPLMLER